VVGRQHRPGIAELGSRTCRTVQIPLYTVLILFERWCTLPTSRSDQPNVRLHRAQPCPTPTTFFFSASAFTVQGPVCRHARLLGCHWRRSLCRSRQVQGGGRRAVQLYAHDGWSPTQLYPHPTHTALRHSPSTPNHKDRPSTIISVNYNGKSSRLS